MYSKKFKKDDIVRVTNPHLKTYNRIGRVISVYGHSVEIQIKGFPSLTFLTTNLELVSRADEFDFINHDIENTKTIFDNIKGDKDMSVKGNYNVALVKFVEGVYTDKLYAFALFDDGIFVEDTVLVDTANGYKVVVIQEIHGKADYEELGSVLPTKEVICKIDFTAFDERKAKRAKAAKLKTDMNKMVKSLQEVAVFELLAEKSPELKAMLEEYKSLAE